MDPFLPRDISSSCQVICVGFLRLLFVSSSTRRAEVRATVQFFGDPLWGFVLENDHPIFPLRKPS
jgi:hypothetical protein